MDQKDRLVPPDQQEHLEPLDLKDLLVVLEHPEVVEHLALMDPQVNKEPQAQPG